MPGGGMQQQQQQQQQQNSGGKAKTAGRGAQNNYKPYWLTGEGRVRVSHRSYFRALSWT